MSQKGVNFKSDSGYKEKIDELMAILGTSVHTMQHEKSKSIVAKAKGPSKENETLEFIVPEGYQEAVDDIGYC